jgi:hypothetical protein
MRGRCDMRGGGDQRAHKCALAVPAFLFHAARRRSGGKPFDGSNHHGLFWPRHRSYHAGNRFAQRSGGAGRADGGLNAVSGSRLVIFCSMYSP